ncbi:hypothetical protein GGS21DRAFT_485704 [Xylaria nigripes]|nr:hypothetical protein GGS21DRAFT_485704 [Xylaria nigripes]
MAYIVAFAAALPLYSRNGGRETIGYVVLGHGMSKQDFIRHTITGRTFRFTSDSRMYISQETGYFLCLDFAKLCCATLQARSVVDVYFKTKKTITMTAKERVTLAFIVYSYVVPKCGVYLRHAAQKNKFLEMYSVNNTNLHDCPRYRATTESQRNCWRTDTPMHCTAETSKHQLRDEAIISIHTGAEFL